MAVWAALLLWMASDPLPAARERMVREQTEARGVRDARVLRAMREVPRHRFVPEPLRESAYRDTPLPIGYGATISQPWIVALMTGLLAPGARDTVLEIGTGSGYQAAVLSRLARQVYSIEIVPALAESAAARLAALGYANVTVRPGDGYKGWPEHAPFDRIILTAAPPEVPQALVDQLACGGRLVAPAGPAGDEQDLVVVEKSAACKVHRRMVTKVLFVPMIHGNDDGP